MADTYSTPTTTLEAVNAMLDVIGAAPVNSIDQSSPLPADVSKALGILGTVNREVQALGWYWNTEDCYPLTRSTSGNIPLPANALRVRIPRSTGVKAVMRGQQLYDLAGHTFIFTQDLKGTVVLLLDFELLPEEARTYIYIRAARRFQASTVGSDQLAHFTDADELAARAALLHGQADEQQPNVFTDSWGVFTTINRQFGLSDPVVALGMI